jgi:uncharacterized phiE125 gp8 family phage protein
MPTAHARLSLVTAPAVEPVSMAELEEYVRVESPADAAFLTMSAVAARRYFEKITGLSLLEQTWLASWDAVPVDAYGLSARELILPRAPLVAISSVKYLAPGSGGVLSTLSSDAYIPGGVGQASAFARLCLGESSEWPALGRFPDALQVTFRSGYGVTASAVPDDLRLALLLLAAHWYENRLPSSAGSVVNDLPHSLSALIELHRVSFIS